MGVSLVEPLFYLWGLKQFTVVVRGVLLAGEELLGVVHPAVDAHADLVHDGGLKVDVDRAGHVLAGRGLREEGVERVVLAANGLISELF